MQNHIWLEGVSRLEIISFDTLPSTQKYLLEEIFNKRLKAPVAVITKIQTDGIGSRENSWSGAEGNFFLSLAIELDDLPHDLPLGSASIYFSFLMKKTLLMLGESVWIKWPNDIYNQNNKVGGVITQKIATTLVCGIGINLNRSTNSYKSLNSDISVDKLSKTYLDSVQMFPSWKQIFSEYQIEFELSRGFLVHIKEYKKSLKDAILCDDGSLKIEGERVYSLR